MPHDPERVAVVKMLREVSTEVDVKLKLAADLIEQDRDDEAYAVLDSLGNVFEKLVNFEVSFNGGPLASA